MKNFADNDDFDYEEWTASINDGFDPSSSWQDHSLVIVQVELEKYDGPDIEYLVALRIPWNFVIPQSADNVSDVIAEAVAHGKPQEEYLSQPRIYSGVFILGSGLDGTSPILCAADCRCGSDFDDLSD